MVIENHLTGSPITYPNDHCSAINKEWTANGGCWRPEGHHSVTSSEEQQNQIKIADGIWNGWGRW